MNGSGLTMSEAPRQPSTTTSSPLQLRTRIKGVTLESTRTHGIGPTTVPTKGVRARAGVTATTFTLERPADRTVEPAARLAAQERISRGVAISECRVRDTALSAGARRRPVVSEEHMAGEATLAQAGTCGAEMGAMDQRITKRRWTWATFQLVARDKHRPHRRRRL